MFRGLFWLFGFFNQLKLLLFTYLIFHSPQTLYSNTSKRPPNLYTKLNHKTSNLVIVLITSAVPSAWGWGPLACARQCGEAVNLSIWQNQQGHSLWCSAQHTAAAMHRQPWGRGDTGAGLEGDAWGAERGTYFAHNIFSFFTKDVAAYSSLLQVLWWPQLKCLIRLRRG